MHVLPEFSLACLVLAALPGPDMALSLHRSVRDGRRAGFAVVAGGEVGMFCWALAAGAGLSALLRANRLLFDGMHVFGAVVLTYLGVSAWRSARRADSGEFGSGLIGRLPSGRSPAAAFRASLLSIAANPKAAVFAFTFYPQFLPTHGPVLTTSALLATVQVVIDSAFSAGVVLLAATFRPWLSRAAVRRRMERVLGTVLIAIGVRLAADTR